MARTGRLWQTWGRDDPYFAVLSTEKYHRRNLGAEAEAEFFASGEQHLTQVLREAERRLGPLARGRALDYGCGVGRVIVPMARAFQSVVGADISASMLARAREQVQRAGLENVQLVLTRDGDGLPRDFDLVHTFIVLQHNRPSAARRILTQLMSRLVAGGVGIVNLTYWEEATSLRKFHRRLRRALRPYDFAVSVLQGRDPRMPSIPMYSHSLSRMLFDLYRLGVGEVSLEFVPQPAGFESVTMYLRRNTRSD